MRFIDKFGSWKVFFCFELTLGEKNEVAVRVAKRQPFAEEAELLGLWAFTTCRILYEIWQVNPPRAFLALDFLARIVRHRLDPATRCFEQAELPHIHYVESARNPIESVIGEYLARGESGRRIRLLAPLGFDRDVPSVLVMTTGVALLQYVVDKVKEEPEWLRPLSDVARFLVTKFGIEEWAGEASREKLPRAALAQVGLMPAQR